MEFACISCWTEFSVKEEDIIKAGHLLKCPTCGYSQAISIFQKKVPEEEKKVEFKKPMNLSQKQKKPVRLEVASDQMQDKSEKIKPIPQIEPAAPHGGEWLVKSISGLIYHFSSIHLLQMWASVLDSSKNFLVSRDGSCWKNLEEFLNYYKQTSNIQLSFERAGTEPAKGVSVLPLSGTDEQLKSGIKKVQPPEATKPEPPKPLTKQTSQFTFKTEEKKSEKYKNTLLIIIIVFAAAIAGGTAILLLMIKGL